MVSAMSTSISNTKNIIGFLTIYTITSDFITMDHRFETHGHILGYKN